MRLYSCADCGGTLYFENYTCGCGATVAFDPEADAFTTEAAHCTNRETIGCNWIAAGSDGGLCRSCAMTETVPPSFREENRQLWAAAELSKRWVLANLARWGWFTDADTGPRPRFELLVEDGRGVVMGHAGGLVTIDLAEADPATRMERGDALGEAYRTMTGHFRHEIGHFVFERLSGNPDFLDAFRTAMGDEREDYDAALKSYYAAGVLPGWQEYFVSPYATSHAHEDWAESFAHLLHLADIADSALAAGLRIGDLDDPDYDIYAETDTAQLIERGAELGLALNHVNRAMGLQDLYPFVLKAPVRDKLALVHHWVTRPA